MSKFRLIDSLSLVNDTVTMLVFVRQGVLEMLEFLSEFCNFYIYSHGFKEYIMNVLQILDPEYKYFPNRDLSVIAPADENDRANFLKNGKSIYDFKDPSTKEPLFKNSDCIFLDDQLLVVKQRGEFFHFHFY